MRRKIFETRNFGLLIGVAVVGLFLAATYLTPMFDNLELKLLNVHFRLKDRNRQVALQEGAIYEERNIAISPDIVILGIDTNSLTQFGRWPWPRWRHADLVNSLARITEQNTRERAVFLDTFFIEPSLDAYSDAVLVDAIANNGRVLLETVLSSEIPPGAAEDEYFQRHEVMFENRGRLANIQGPWWEMRVYLGIEPPLQPYGAVLAGYGHANFDPDYDGVYRHQPIIARVSREIEEIPLDDLTVNTPVGFDNYERLAWIDKDGDHHHIDYPLTEQILDSLRAEMERLAPVQIDSDSSDESGSDTGYYVVRRYQDQFLPSITLSLALEYFNKDFSDLDIVIGDHVTIPDPQYFDTETGEWGPYYITETAPVYDEEGSIVEPGDYRLVDQIEIPINQDGEMLINYMGPRSSSSRDGYQTYPVRSYATYASRVPGPDPYDWRPTLALNNKIVMAGPFAAGMAEDEKTTPFGLMYGVEMHANALNTIIMDRFLDYAPFWMNLVILAGSVLLIAFLVGRMKNPIWSFVIMLALIAAFFLTVSIIFDRDAFIINFTSPTIAMFMAFLAVLVYRALTEGRDRARTRELFAKSVSPNVVEWILDRDASGELELGGENKEMTVFFSDIRGWTTFSETMEPKELLDHLNEYLSAMSDVIIEYNGTLDKYVGDEIMAFWGAPKSQREHAILACKCALKQKLVLEELNAGWPERKRLKIGMGINTGVMTAGLMGSSTKREYSLTGDNVNLGARLEGINKEYGTMIIISEGTYQLVRDQVVARELDRVYAKGKHQAVTIYELWEVKGGLTPTPEELANE